MLATPVASLFRSKVGFVFEVRTDDVVDQQLAFEIEQLAKSILQMRLGTFLERKQSIKPTVQAMAINQRLSYSEQVR